VTSGLATATFSASSAYAGNTRARSSASASWPMLAHTSVYRTSASREASIGSCVIVTLPPVSRAMSDARCTTCGIGSNPGGVPARTCIPDLAPPSSNECVTLLPSPRYVIVLPASSPFTSRMVSRSARHWHGCSKSDSAFTTGTEAADARTSRRSCSNVRSTIAWTYLDRTRPVSSMVSPRPSCNSAEDSATGWPPADATAISNETRVRVEGFSKIRATERPARRSA